MSAGRIVLFFALFAATANARSVVGTFATWAAFCDEPSKCFAISQPAERRGDPFFAIAASGRGLSLTAHVGRPVRAASVRIGGETFALTPRGEDAVADARQTIRIVAAMRAGEVLTVVATSMQGGRIRHHYDLAGAPSAIDAAALASRR